MAWQGRAADPRGEFSPGRLYKEIKVSREEFEDEGEGELKKKKIPGFVSFCKSIHKSFSLGKGASFSEEIKNAVEFLDWPLTADEYSSTVKFVLYSSIFGAIILGVILFVLLGELVSAIFPSMAFMAPLFVFAPLLIIAMYAANFVQTYPLAKAKEEQTRALTYVPEIMGYMIMSMKLVPNLEKAIEFSAGHGRGKIADDFKRIIWDVQLGVYTTLSEALDNLAYRWGDFSEEFKHALMMVRASVIENTEDKRYQVLDKTMDEILESIRNKMEQYARNLSQPTTMLFYIGVLLPLILIIILPVGSSFSGAPLANPILLFLLYCIIIPAVALSFASNLVKQRPPVYEPPNIPENTVGLPPKNKMLIGKSWVDLRAVALLVLIAGSAVTLFVSTEGIPPKFLLSSENERQLIPAYKDESQMLEANGRAADYFAPPSNENPQGGQRYRELLSQSLAPEKAQDNLATEHQLYFMDSKRDVAPYVLIFGIMITVSLALFVYLYHMNIYRRKKQVEVIRMEEEFKDAIYILASRMGENKPVEEALKHAKEFLPNFKVSEQIFGRIIDNISMLNMPLDAAVFDPHYGVLKDNPSAVIRSSMRLLVDSVQLGVNVAARTMIALSIQLTNAQKVNKMLKTLVSDTTNMMRSMALFIAPVVLGITTALQKIVIVTLASIASSGLLSSAQTDLSSVSVAGISGNFSVSSFIKPDSVKDMVNPTQFIFIIALYILELVVIMIFFTTKIEEDNDLLVRVNIAKYLPIAIIVFIGSIVLSNFIVGSFLGG
ncbi:MAG: type II secretion system F family protein [Candidatus Diapherotrites archaeon]